MQFVAIDIETTGLDPHRNGVIEFAAIYADLAGTFEPKTFHRFILPTNMIWDFYCLKLHSTLIQEIDQLAASRDHRVKASLEQVGDEFKRWAHFECNVPFRRTDDQDFRRLEKITAAGKNFGSFDLQFLIHSAPEFFGEAFRHRSLDPTMYFIAPEDKIMPDLAGCKLRAGLVPKVAHRALQDCWDVVDLLQKKFRQ